MLALKLQLSTRLIQTLIKLSIIALWMITWWWCRHDDYEKKKILIHFPTHRRDENLQRKTNNNQVNNLLPSKSMSMSNLNNKSLDRFQMRSNLSTISTDSTTSINSLGKSKRRAPLPPRVATSKKQLSMNQVSIPEETPSMVQLEQHYNVNHSVPKNTESEVRRILPEVPKQPLPPPPPLATQYEPDIVPKPKIASKPPGGVQDRVKAVKGISFLKGKLIIDFVSSIWQELTLS